MFYSPRYKSTEFLRHSRLTSRYSRASRLPFLQRFLRECVTQNAFFPPRPRSKQRTKIYFYWNKVFVFSLHFNLRSSPSLLGLYPPVRLSLRGVSGNRYISVTVGLVCVKFQPIKSIEFSLDGDKSIYLKLSTQHKWTLITITVYLSTFVFVQWASLQRNKSTVVTSFDDVIVIHITLLSPTNNNTYKKKGWICLKSFIYKRNRYSPIVPGTRGGHIFKIASNIVLLNPLSSPCRKILKPSTGTALGVVDNYVKCTQNVQKSRYT